MYRIRVPEVLESKSNTHVFRFTSNDGFRVRERRLPRERTMNPEEPDFANARTLQFHNLDGEDNAKDDSARSARVNIFDNVYKMTTVDG